MPLWCSHHHTRGRLPLLAGASPAPALAACLPLQETLRLGGVELLLSQCQLDEDSPLTREWALWAIRNLSISNPDVQQRIKVRSSSSSSSSSSIPGLG